MFALQIRYLHEYLTLYYCILKKNQNAPRPSDRPLSILLFFFFSCFFFLRIAGVAQAIMLWHMLLFGDAFGPAYAIFCFFCIQLCSFFRGSNLKKCFQQAITLLYGRFRRSQCCVQRMCVQQMYACMQSTFSVCIQQYDPETYLET